MHQTTYHKTVLKYLQSNNILDYLTTNKQKKDLGYPLRTLFNQFQEITLPPKLAGMDCEMVQTEGGSELVQVIIIDDQANILYEQWFNPKYKIIDYVTHITGLTEDILLTKNRKYLELTDLQQIHQIIKGYILVGHDLANDLQVLPITHHAFIDTLALYPHNYGLPFKTKLKNLAMEVLNRPIQWNHHNPIEDAKAAIDIVKFHINQGRGIVEEIQADVKLFKNYHQIVDQAELIEQKIVGFILRGSRALNLQIEQEGYLSDWDYVCIYNTSTQINGKLIKLYNIDITIYDEITFNQIISNGDISLLQLYYLPPQCQYINKLQHPTIQLSLIRDSLGYHLGKCDRKLKRFKHDLTGEKRNWKILKVYHMKIKFLDYFLQFNQFNNIQDIKRTNIIWQNIKMYYKNTNNIEEAQRIMIQTVTKMHNDVRKAYKSVKPLRYKAQNEYICRNKAQKLPEFLNKQKIKLRQQGDRILQKYLISNININPLNLQLVNELLSNGLPNIQTFRITYKRHKIYPNLIQFHYLQSANFNLQICRQSRGIILDEDNHYSVVALPYFKFFDYNDPRFSQLNKFEFNNYVIYQKFDGSTAVLYYYRGGWQVASAKVPDGQNYYCFARSQTTTEFKKQFWKIFHKLDFVMPSQQDADCTFIFELLSKDHIIVVRRSQSQLRLHGVRNRKTGQQLNHILFAQKYNWKEAKPLNLATKSIQEVINISKTLNPLQCQGFVLCDSHFCRLKVKNPGYVKANWLAELNLGPTKQPKRYLLTEIILAGEASAFCTYCPEWQKPIKQFEAKLRYLNQKCINIYKRLSHLTGKELAFQISKEDKVLHPFVFGLFSNFDKWNNRLQYLMPAKKLFGYLQAFEIKLQQK